MSETTATTPEPKTSESTSSDNFVSFADAFEAGLETSETTAQQPAPVETPKAKETVIEKSSIEKANPLDVLTKRLTGQEEAVKTEPTVEEEIKAPENLKPEAQTAWAKLTKELRDARTKIKDLETKTSEAPNNSIEQADLKAQLEALKSERDEYENELRFSRLEATKEYKQAVTEPLSIIQREVSEIAKIYETDPNGIFAAMAEPDTAKRRAMLKDATASFDPVDSLAIRQKAEDLQKVFERRDLLTKDVKTVLEMLESDEKKETEAYQQRMQQEIQEAYKAEWETLQKENPLLRPIEDNEAWNNTLQAIEKQALDIENTELDPRAKARLTFNAAAMPVVMQVFQDYVSKTQSRINDLEKLTKELRATIPSAGADTGAAPEIPSDLGFLDALERGMNKR